MRKGGVNDWVVSQAFDAQPFVAADGPPAPRQFKHHRGPPQNNPLGIAKMRLALIYELEELGWARCRVQAGDRYCEVTASYLSDALGHLVLAACATLRFFKEVSFAFEEEPGEYRWVIHSMRLNEIEVRILWFPYSEAYLPDDDGEEKFRVVCLPATFARAVYDAATAVLDLHGLDGYLERWGEDAFPAQQVLELRRLLVASREHPDLE